MENEQPGQGPRRRRIKKLPELTAEEMKLLLIKRWVDKHDLMRIFNLKDTAFHDMVNLGVFVHSLCGKKKLYDLQDIYKKLDDGKGKDKPD